MMDFDTVSRHLTEAYPKDPFNFILPEKKPQKDEKKFSLPKMDRPKLAGSSRKTFIESGSVSSPPIFNLGEIFLEIVSNIRVQKIIKKTNQILETLSGPEKSPPPQKQNPFADKQKNREHQYKR